MTLPDVKVEVAFGGAGNTTYFMFNDLARGAFNTGTFGPTGAFTDVTADTRAVSTQRGKQRILDAYRPGSISVSLDNRAGNYDPNNLSGTYVVAGRTQVLPMVPVRVRAQFLGAVYDLAYGYADSWDIGYRDIADAITTLQATDGFKVIAATNEPSPIQAPALRATTTSTGVEASSITLNKPSGTTTGDVMVASIVSTSYGFNMTAPVGWVFILATGAVAPFGSSGIVAGQPIGVLTYVKTATGSEPSSYTWSGVSSDYFGFIATFSGADTTDGWASSFSPGGSADVLAPVNFTTHHANELVLLIVANGNFADGPPTYYGTEFFIPTGFTGIVDINESVTDGAGHSHTANVNASVITQEVAASLGSVVGELAPDPLGANPGGWVAHMVGLAPALLGAGEDSGARIDRILNNVGWSATDRDIDTGYSELQATDLTTDAMAEIQAVTLTELGEFYMAADGKATFRNRGRKHAAAGVSVYNSFVDDNYLDATIAYDDELIVNSATGTNIGGVTQSASDSASIAQYLKKSYTQSGLWNTLDSATNHWAEWVVELNKDPELRVEQLTFRLGSNDTLTALLLGAEFGDYFRITRTPPGGDVIQRFVFLIGISWNIKPLQWDATCLFASATGYENAIVFNRTDPNVGFNNSGFIFTY